jgi:Zn finger protein HypA/HybF involved in hydrogenase expression
MAKKLSTEEFIKRARNVHGDLYQYNKTEYLGNRTKIIITCPIHGTFEQTPNAHIRGRGCPKCGIVKCTQDIIKSNEQVIEEFVKVHGDKYKYDLVKYVKDDIKVIIVCPVHGEFKQIPSSHLQGCGCPECGKEQASNKRSHTFEYFIDQAIKVHGENYTYEESSYKSYKKHANILCNTCGQMFITTPQHHVGGTGCPNCATSGFNKSKSAILYYLKITTEDNKVLYKIGITNRTVKERFNLTDLSKIEIIKQEKFELGQDALDREIEIKRKFKEFQYKGPNILSSDNTELFTKDILSY